MAHRKTYYGGMTPLPPRGSRKALIGTVSAGAALALVALIMAKGGSNGDEPGKFVGLRHDAMNVGDATDVTSAGSNSAGDDRAQEPSAEMVVRNGVTVISPRLLVPVIDIDSLQAGNGSEEGASVDKAYSRKHSRYARQSHRRHQQRWSAYGLALR